MKRNIFTALISILSVFTAHHSVAGTPYNIHLERIVQNTGLDKNIVELALKGHEYAVTQGVVKKNILTIVNYAQPSSENRLYVIDLNTDQLLFNTRVAHGSKSGLLHSDYFSNNLKSHQSSLGVFVTTQTYEGKHGESLKIAGLEKGINDNVQKRHVVIHSADYMSDSYLNKYGYSGRSSGCLAVKKLDINKLIHLTMGGSVIFSYAPAENNDPNLTNISIF